MGAGGGGLLLAKSISVTASETTTCGISTSAWSSVEACDSELCLGASEGPQPDVCDPRGSEPRVAGVEGTAPGVAGVPPPPGVERASPQVPGVAGAAGVAGVAGVDGTLTMPRPGQPREGWWLSSLERRADPGVEGGPLVECGEGRSQRRSTVKLSCKSCSSQWGRAAGRSFQALERGAPVLVRRTW